MLHESSFFGRDAALHLRYGPGCILEGTFAVWLLIHAESYRPFGIWIAYFLLPWRPLAC